MLLLDSEDNKKTIVVKGKQGQLPIHLSCMRNAPLEVIQLLLDRHTDNKSISEKTNHGELPLHVACFQGVLNIESSLALSNPC